MAVHLAVPISAGMEAARQARQLVLLNLSALAQALDRFAPQTAFAPTTSPAQQVMGLAWGQTVVLLTLLFNAGMEAV